MTCRECLGVADAFLADELLTETNQEILQHVATCPACREDIEDRHQFRLFLRTAFEQAPQLQPCSDLRVRLRETMRAAARRPRRDWRRLQAWPCSRPPPSSSSWGRLARS